MEAITISILAVGLVVSLAGLCLQHAVNRARVNIEGVGGLSIFTNRPPVPWGHPHVVFRAQNVSNLSGRAECDWSQTEDPYDITDLPSLIQDCTSLHARLPEITQRWAENEAKKDTPSLKFCIRIIYEDLRGIRHSVERSGYWSIKGDQGYWVMGRQVAKAHYTRRDLMNQGAWIAFPILMLAGIVGTYRYAPVEVKTGTVYRCLDLQHPGDNIMRSTTRILRVARKDAGRYSVTEESLTCEKCQARRDAEERAARARQLAEERAAKARKVAEMKFANALWIHDAAVYACIKRFTSATQSGSVSQGKRQMRELRRLAYQGKKLYAPASLADVESHYRQSMDQHLLSVSDVEEGLRSSSDFETHLMLFAVHTAAARSARDEAIDALKRRGYYAPTGIVSYAE